MATMARTRAPAALATPEDVARAETAVAPQREALQQFQTEESRLMGDVRAAEEEALKAKESRDIAVKEAEAKQLGLSAEQQRGLTEKAQREIEKNPFPTFKPSQEDAVSYSQLGSLVGTLGMMLGGGAKGSAKVAIGAMTGMMKGWQTGRKELWDREVKVFDKEVQRIKAVHDSIYKDLDLGLKQLATDREAGRAKLMSAAWKAGTNSVVATLINNGRAQDALKILRDGYKLSSDIDKRVQDLALAQRRHEEAQQLRREQIAATTQLAQIKAAGKGGALSAQQQSFEDMVSISLNEAAAQVENLATMTFATTGIWQGRNTKGLLDAPIGVLTNTLTSQDVQRYNAVIGIIGREAAKVFAGGRIITDKAAEDFSNQFKVREGDKPFTVLEKMANIRQFFERAIEVKQARPDAAPGMQKIYINALESFKNSIPITNKEVNEAKRQAEESKGKSKKTFGKVMEEMGKPRATAAPVAPVAPVAAPTQEPNKKPMPSGEKLSAYAKTHFGGDEVKAREYLETQGYE